MDPDGDETFCRAEYRMPFFASFDTSNCTLTAQVDDPVFANMKFGLDIVLSDSAPEPAEKTYNFEV